MTTLRGSYNYLWDISKQLGQGATSMVYRGRNKSTGEEVAVKVFTQAGNMRPHDVQMREYTVMKKLKHWNIVPLLDIEEEQGTHSRAIIMELTEYGSLYTMLEEPQNAYGLPEEEFLIVLEHVTSGVKHLYENDIVHRDIKPGNILRFKGEDGRSIYKLTDFGAAKELEHEEEQFMSLYGTEEYLHPDIYQRAVLRNPVRNAFTSKVDLWSLGVTLFHVGTGQLPFKPFGGRKNRDKMYQITRNKESGVIMGIQQTEDGPIQWSKELPQTCRLSLGLKLLLTPIIAGLLESKPEKVWTFDYFFSKVAAIMNKTTVHVFSPQNWAQLKIYIDKHSKLTQLQERIAEQTEIVSNNQFLIFDGQTLTEIVKPLQPVTEYPKGITENNPIVCFNKVEDDSYKFPDFAVKDFPKFTSSLSPDDYLISKMCAGIACYTMKEVEAYVKKQDLVRRSVHICIQNLYHEIQHLMDYSCFLNKNCQTTMKWKENYEQTTVRELEMVNLLPWDVQAGEINAFVLELQLFVQESDRLLNDIYSKGHTTYILVSSQLEELKTNQIERKLLKALWSDEHGCQTDERCVDKMAVLVDHILKIKGKFNEDRKKPSLNFNDEQIHKYDKNKLSEWCIKVKSLFHDHCFSKARLQFRQFLSWYRSAQECRAESERIEKRLLDLAEGQEQLAEALNRQCILFHQKIEEFIQHLKNCERAETPPRGDIASEKRHSSEKSSPHTTNLVKQLVRWVTENQKVVIESRRLVEENTEMMQRLPSALTETSTEHEVESIAINGLERTFKKNRTVFYGVEQINSIFKWVYVEESDFSWKDAVKRVR